jgi:molybdate transport system regulatory protein
MTHALVPRINLWLEHDGQVALSLWRVALLEAIASTGSISSAAEQMQVPYRVAWSKIREMEERLHVPLVETRIGGTDGGGARLTPEAERYVQRFHRFSDGIEAWIEQKFAEVFQERA